MTRLAAPFEGIGALGMIILMLTMVCVALAAGHRLRQLEKGFPPTLVQNGVVHLATPWSAERAVVLYRQIFLRSGEKHRSHWGEVLRRHTLVDFAFAAAVSLLLALACSALARGLDAAQPRLASIIALLAWGSLAAFVFDALENAGILWMLHGCTSAPWPQLTTIASVLKWTIYAGGTLAVLAGLPLWAVQTVRQILGSNPTL